MAYNEELGEGEIARQEEMDRTAKEYALAEQKGKWAIYWHKFANSGVWFPSNKLVLLEEIKLLKPQKEVYDIILMEIKNAHLIKGKTPIPTNLQMSKEKMKELGI